MSDKTVNNGPGQTENQEGEPTVTKVPKIIEFLEGLKTNAGKLSDVEVTEKIFELAADHFKECWTARLPQTAEAEFNHVALAFSILQKMLLVRHGAKAVPVEPEPEDKPLISLS